MDGRNVDESIGILEGEAAQLKVRELDETHPAPVPRAITQPPLVAAPTYYNQPVLKEPVWKWYVPAYFYVGGAAGAASVLGAAATLMGGLHRLSRACRWVGTIGDMLGTGLLIADLGRPSRFLNMLRVFRASSPMSVGSWVLAGSGAMNTAGLLLGNTALGNTADVLGGIAGVPLSGYTAVLLTHTAVPVWQNARRTLPALFVASAASSAAALLDLFPLGEREQRVVRRFGFAAKIAALGSAVAVERELALAPPSVRPLKSGFSGALWMASHALTLASFFPRRRRTRSLLATVGALAMRFAIAQAGKRSARDPQATFIPQRSTSSHQSTGR